MQPIHLTHLLFSVLIILTSVPILRAAAPGEINYQGKLADSNGNPITNPSFPITFRIFHSEGNLLYSENHNANVSKGVFSLLVGTGNSRTYSNEASLCSNLACVMGVNADLDLEVQANGVTLTPRQKLVASPFAMAVAENSVGSGEIKDGTVGAAEI
ncbi:MAG: hypothetical protein HY548_06240, partial [Elusimicrobia bacterium]|nr:hypothetical protein [Elusimicrobiota bacterium]